MNNPLMVNERSCLFHTDSGSRKQEIFHGELQPDNSIKLVSDGFADIQDYIESFRQSTEIESIIARVNNGELDLLSARPGYYSDIVGLPSTMSEALQNVIDMQHLFDQLPADVRSKFNNSFDEWYSQLGDQDFLEKSGFVQKVSEVASDVVNSPQEVVSNES